MKLSFFYQMVTTMANNTNAITDVFTATILWHDREQDVEILAMGKRPLVGRALLAGNYLGIDFRENGAIRIEERP